jgi:hypothetical protein
MCITEPLGLVTSTHVVNTKALTLGAAIQTHVSTIQSRGFMPTIIHLDPEKGFAALDPHIPGVEVEICGAGDHTNPIDVIIRHVKEIFRSVQDSLPWDQPEWLDKDMVTYCTSRKNLRSTPHSNVSARVKFTGRKPVFKKELGIAYGDYCECNNPAVISRNSSPRTEPCVALYPTTNANGSWVFLNLNSKRRVRRTNWDKMVTSDLVINIMNEFSRAGTEDAPPVAEDDEVGEPAADGRASPIVEEEVQDQHVPEVEPVEQPEEEPTGELEEMVNNDDDLPEGGKDPPPRRSARTIGGVRRPKLYMPPHVREEGTAGAWH